MLPKTKSLLTTLDGPNHHNRDELLRRNGRWGTCVDCPRDSLHGVMPETCRYTERHDHCLKRPNHEAWEEIDGLETHISRARAALLGMSTMAWKARSENRAVLVFAAKEDGARALGAIALDVPEAEVSVTRAPNQDRCNALLLENEEDADSVQET